MFIVFTLTMGLSDYVYNQEVIFLGSMAIVIFLIVKLTRELDANARRTLVGTAIIIFVFRAIPTPGPGMTWWMIDDLKFDQHFFSILVSSQLAFTAGAGGPVKDNRVRAAGGGKTRLPGWDAFAVPGMATVARSIDLTD